MTDALSHTTSYTYDTSDRVATQTDPLSQLASHQFDKNGNLTQTTDRKSQVTNYQYDALDRPSLITFHDGSTIGYTYDAGDRVTQIVDSANGTIARTYDGMDRVTQETTPQGTVSYTYDGDGRRATMTVAGQTLVSYAYDNAHRLTSITQGAATVSLTYDDANRRSTLTFPDGIVANSGYDSADRLTSLTYTRAGNTLGNLMYAYDAVGNRTSVGGSWARTGLPAAVGSSSYDAGNRLTASGGLSFSYDSNGSLASDGLTSYSWNARNQLVGLSGGTGASFLYDGVGRRRSKTVSGMTTNFLYDRLNFVQEQSTGGAVTANLLTGLGIDETYTRTDAVSSSALLVDGLGSTLELADASGVPTTHFTFEPFGVTTASGASSAAATQFAGRENDKTGLYNYRARYMSPGLARFISEDPIGYAGGLNPHSYVANNPTNATDPTGLFICKWHRFLTIGATAGTGIPLSLAESLAQAVCDVDNGTQGTDSSDTHRHAMGGRKPNKKYETCEQAYDGARSLLNDLLQNGSLADALHLIQDQWPIGHRFQRWVPIDVPADIRHRVGDELPGNDVLDSAAADSARLLNDLLNGRSGNADDYLHDFCR